MRLSAALSSAIAVLLCLSCAGEPRLVKISENKSFRWYVDELPPGKTAHKLYYDAGKGPVLVDREVEQYRVWANGACVLYEAAHPEGRLVFVVAGRLTPIAVTTSDALRPWRFDTRFVRRFDGPKEIDGRVVLTVEQIDYADICNPAQMQPPRDENWAQRVHVDPGRFKVEQSVIEVNGTDSVGNSVLSDAARNGEIVLVDELIRAGADVNAANAAGITVLMSAIVRENGEVVRRLIQGGAIVDAQDRAGMTALMHAAKYHNLEIGRILLDAGASVTIRDNSGRTAQTWLADSDGVETRELRALLQRAENATK